MKTFSPKRCFGKRPVTIRNSRRARRTFLRPFVQQLEDRVMLSTLIVNNPTDAHVANETSLREAIVLANTDAAAGTSDTITFDASLGSHTITLTQGQLELSGAGAGTITIDGSSPSTPVTLEAIHGIRVFQIDSGVQAVITNLNIENGFVGYWGINGSDIFNAGKLIVSNANVSNSFASSGGAIENTGTLTLSNTTLSGNNANTSGGAIDNSGTLVVIDSTFTSNSAPSAGAISNDGTLTIVNSIFSINSAANSGGAIKNDNSGTLTINGGFFTGNSAANAGAIYNTSSTTATVSNVVFSGNTAATSGGAIGNYGGPLTLTNTTVSGGKAQYGGGIYNNAGSTLTVIDSTVSGNESVSNNNGGGIDNGGTLTLTGATVSQNFSQGSGGGIENDGGTLSVSNTTLSGNTANSSGGGINNNGGTLTLGNTIVAGNRASRGGPDVNGSITTDSGYNLLGTAVKNATNDPTPGPGDVFSDNPGLAALGNYGGPTQTLALLAGSPAIGAGNAAATNPATDQRGLPRLVSGMIDIGAFQTQPPTLAFTTLGQTADAGQPITITLQLEDLDGNPVAAGNGGTTVTLASSSTGAAFLDTNGNCAGRIVHHHFQGLDQHQLRVRGHSTRHVHALRLRDRLRLGDTAGNHPASPDLCHSPALDRRRPRALVLRRPRRAEKPRPAHDHLHRLQ